MSGEPDLLGTYVPGTSLLHRLPIAAKYVLVLGLTVPAVLLGSPLVTALLVAAAVGALAVARVPPRVAYRLPWSLVLLLLVLAGYHAVAGNWVSAVTAPGGVLLAVLASRLLICTTPAPQLLDALVRAAGPLRHVGADPERVALAVALMVRSVPYLLRSYASVREAATARGVQRNPLALVTPVVVGAVGYAQATGEALAARGLGEADRPADATGQGKGQKWSNEGPDVDHF